MSPTGYISQQAPERQAILTALQECIIANDKTVSPVVEPMMGKEMIIYKEGATMKYALSSVKKYMSVHCLPMYMNPALHAKYSALLPKAEFQKGCYNFTDGENVPLEIVGQLIAECAGISIVALLENRKKK
jgi:hypothetical protein